MPDKITTEYTEYTEKTQRRHREDTEQEKEKVGNGSFLLTSKLPPWTEWCPMTGCAINQICLNYRDEVFLNAVTQFCRELFAIRVHHRLFAKIEDGRESLHRKKPEQVGHEGYVLPPADHVARRRL